MKMWVWKNRLKRIITPSMWVMVGNFTRSESYDNHIRKEMEAGTLLPRKHEFYECFTAIDSQGNEVWVSNYPYGFGYEYDPRGARRIGELTMPILKNYIQQKIDTNEVVTPLDVVRWKVRHPDLSWTEYLNTTKDTNEE